MKPCTYGHLVGRDKRGNCKECGRLRYHTNPEYRKAQIARTKFRHANNPEAWNARHRKYRAAKKAALVAYKGGKCADCENTFPDVCYDFDHRDPFAKSFTIAWEIGKPLDELLQEVDKCDLVCRNCHAIRTAGNPAVSKKLRLGQLRRRT